MRPVFLSHAGLWCAAGGSAPAIREYLAAGRVPARRLRFLEEDVPYGFATDVDRSCEARLAEALEATGASVDLAGLAPNAPLLIGSSSLLIGAGEALPWPPPPGFRLPGEGLADAIRSKWNLGNKGWTFSTGCTSGVHALEAGLALVESGAAEEALVLGVELLNRTTPSGFAALQLLTSTEAKPLDADRSGLVLGEAVAAVRLTARPAPWRLHAPALALDVTSTTGHAADGSTIAETMRRALAHAGLAPADLRAIKLQAAGGRSTDALEARAVRLLFGEAPPALVSLKAGLGHTLGACGLAEMVALLNCGEAGWLPPTAGFSRPDPELGLCPTRGPLPWTEGALLLNIQGFGGGLASWVVERA
jgi:3-oxoacyl-[acyl-carrier-protein] synthase-1